MIAGVLLLLVSNVASVVAAGAISAPLRTGRASVDLLITLIVRLFLISAVILVAGIGQVLRAIPLGAFGALALLVLVGFGAHRRLPRLTEFQIPRASWILIAAGVLILLRAAGQVWFFAPYGFDALSYHLTKIPEWIQAGGFTREMGPDTHAPFPAGFELIETWWVVFLHHDVLIEMAGVEFFVVALVSVFVLAQSAGLDSKGALLAAVAYSLTPAVSMAVTSCANDLAVAALVLATLASVAVGLHPGFVVLLIGLGLGVKATFGYALPGVALLWLLRDRALERPTQPSRWSIPLGCAGLSVGAFWYLRNLVWFGNPVYPVGFEGLIAPTGEKKIQFGPSLTSLYQSLSCLVESRITDRQWPYNSLLIFISGWGALSLACGVPSLIAALRSSAALRKLAAAFGTSLVSILLLVNHDPWCFRFVSFFPAIFAIAFAWMGDKVRDVLVIGALAGLVQFPLSTFAADLRPRDYLRLAGMGWRERSISTVVQADHSESTIAYFVDEPVHHRGESYLLYRPDYSARVVHLRAQTPRELVDQMRRGSASVVYVSLTSSQPPELIRTCVRLNLLRPLRGRFYGLTSAGVR